MSQYYDVCAYCVYNPPSSCDGKPCTMCPATGGEVKGKDKKRYQLIKRIKRMSAKLGKLKQERDLAISLLPHECESCKREEGSKECEHCFGNAEAWNVYEDCWEWKGIGGKDGELEAKRDQ